MRYRILCLLWMLVGSSSTLLNAGSVRVVDLDTHYFQGDKPFERLVIRCSVSISSTSAFIRCAPISDAGGTLGFNPTMAVHSWATSPFDPKDFVSGMTVGTNRSYIWLLLNNRPAYKLSGLHAHLVRLAFLSSSPWAQRLSTNEWYYIPEVSDFYTPDEVTFETEHSVVEGKSRLSRIRAFSPHYFYSGSDPEARARKLAFEGGPSRRQLWELTIGPWRTVDGEPVPTALSYVGYGDILSRTREERSHPNTRITGKLRTDVEVTEERFLDSLPQFFRVTDSRLTERFGGRHFDYYVTNGILPGVESAEMKDRMDALTDPDTPFDEGVSPERTRWQNELKKYSSPPMAQSSPQPVTVSAADSDPLRIPWVGLGAIGLVIAALVLVVFWAVYRRRHPGSGSW